MTRLVTPRLFRATLSATLILGGTRLAAQDSSDTARLAPWCEAVRASLQRRDVPQELIRGLGNLRSCPGVAREVLASLWRPPSADSAALRMLAEVTPVLGDDRAYVAIEQLARDGSAPPRQRLAALQALAAYAVPGTILAYRNLDRPGLPVQGYVMLGTSHEERRTTDSRNSARAHQALLDVAHAEPESLVKTIAAYIARRVTMAEHIGSPYTE